MIEVRHYLVAFLLVSVGASTCAYAQPTKNDKGTLPDSLNLYLSLAHGFLNHEGIVILQVTSKGDTICVFSDELIRVMGVDDVNSFTIRLERGKVNKIIVECIQRGVKFSQRFFFHRSNAYLELGIDMRNEFHAMSQDVPSVKE